MDITAEKNESIRRAIASRLGQAYEQVVRELTAASAPLKTVHLSTQVSNYFYFIYINVLNL